MTCRRCLSCYLPMLVAWLFCISCSSSSSNARVTPGGSQSGIEVGAPLAGFGLPAPSTFAGRLHSKSAAKSTSYVPADLLKQAEVFDAVLPHQNVADIGALAAFEPDWQPGDADASGLSYAMYAFNITGYGGDATFHFLGMVPQPAPGSVFLALANWDTDTWNWYPVGDGLASLPSLDDHVAFGGGLLACVLVIGTEPYFLDWLRLGSIPPNAQLTANTRFGLTPFTVNFNAAASTDSDGTIAEYRWDPEGDGSFSESTGTDPLFSHEYAATGGYTAAVRVIDDGGVYQDAALTISAVDEIKLSYGSEDHGERAAAIIFTDSGQLMLLGERISYEAGTNANVLVALVAPDGTAGLAREWVGIDEDRILDATRAADGKIYACGSSFDFSKTTGSALLQQWSQAGELLWSKTIAKPESTMYFKALTVVGDSIYACGQLYTSTGYGIVCRFALDGSLIWARTLVAPYFARFADIAYYNDVIAGTQSIRLSGSYYLLGQSADCLYAEFSLDGDWLSSMTWGVPGNGEEGEAISIVGATPATYIASATQKNGNKGVMLGRPGGTTVEVTSTGVPLDTAALSGRTLLMEISMGDQDQSFIVASFSQALALLEHQLVSALPNGLHDGNALAFLGSGICIAGTQTGAHPGPVPSTLSVEASAVAWADVFPPVGSPSDLVVAATSIDTSLPSGFAFNRQAADEDMFVYLVP